MFKTLTLIWLWAITPALPLHAPGGHDFHVSIGRMAVEGNQAMLQIRLFKDDLELGMRAFFKNDDLLLKVDPKTDSLFTTYFNSRFVIKHGGEQIKGVVATSGEDELYGYPVWWYTLSYQGDKTLDVLEIDHQVLMEQFNDQQNVLRVTYFPADEEKMYYLVEGASAVTLTF